MNRRLKLIALAGALGLSSAFAIAQDAPEILLDKPAPIVAYQLKRLTNGQLQAVKRNATEAKYKPVYLALLTRKAMDRKFRQEAVDALVKLNESDPATVLLEAIPKVDEDDKATPHDLVGMLVTLKPDVLGKQREKLQALAGEADRDLVKQAAYAALATADGKPDAVWKQASDADGGLKLLLGGVPMIADAKVRGAFFPLVKPLVAQAPDDATRVAAIEAAGSLAGHEAEAFGMLAGIIRASPGANRDAAVRSVQRIPVAKWPTDQVAPLAKAVVDLVGQIPGEQRNTPAVAQAVQLGNDLAAKLPAAEGQPVRKKLRELAGRSVVVHTLREQMLFDLRYFAVQTGKPVQIVLQNEDAMPHNFVLTAPGALMEVATAGAAIQPTGMPDEKAFVPNTPKVLQSTPLVQPEESATLSFVAPAKAGEYPFVCTFPGHAARMYGVMLVVDDLDAWEQQPKAPSDPTTHQPFAKQKNDATDGPPMQHEHP